MRGTITHSKLPRAKTQGGEGEALKDGEAAGRQSTVLSLSTPGIPVLDLGALGPGAKNNMDAQMSEFYMRGRKSGSFSNASRFPYRPMFGMQQRVPLSHVGPREK